jgi:eukaryotic-like serine/threonine-protein kinase
MELGARLKAGNRVGPYEICRPLGVGFSGEVHEAAHVFTKHRVAIKYLHSEHVQSEHKVSRFSAEATTLFKLDHANVVRVLDAGWDDGAHPWMAMELLEGQTLGALLAAQGRLSPRLALKYALGIAWGVDAAHEIGVIHRDLKPDNVFVTKDGGVKVIDFSAAKFLTADLRTTRPPEMTCTLAYAPPELLQGEQADARIDVYSLGLILWQMLVGRHPFEDVLGKQQALITAHFLRAPELLTKAAKLPAYFDVLLKPAVAKPLGNRYTTIARFAQAIMKAQLQMEADVADGELVLDVPPGEPPEPQDPKARRHYQPPEPTPRPDTAPAPPAERVTLSSHVLPHDAPAEEPGIPKAAVDSALARLPAAPAQRDLTSLGPMGTVPLPVADVAAAVESAKAAMAAAATEPVPAPPRRPFTERMLQAPSPVPAPAPSSPAVTSVSGFTMVSPLPQPSSPTPEPVSADAIEPRGGAGDERSRPTIARKASPSEQGMPVWMVGVLCISLAIVSSAVGWVVTGGRRPAIQPRPAAAGPSALPTTLAPDTPDEPEPAALPSSASSATPAPAIPSATAGPRAVPSSRTAAPVGTVTAARSPKPPVPLFELPAGAKR